MGDSYQKRIEKAKRALEDTEYILLGAGGGLSAAAGKTYKRQRFSDNLSPFINRYGLTVRYSSAFYPFPLREERWAYLANYISFNYYDFGPTKIYKDLYQLVQDKKYFILTSNVDGQFEKAGFSAHKIFEVRGNYGYLQCAQNCHDKRYSNEMLVRKMVEETINCKIPPELVPLCPECSREMVPTVLPNLIQDEKWYEQEALYGDFNLSSTKGKSIYLELGLENNNFIKLEYRNETIIFLEDMREVISSLMNPSGCQFGSA
ncbi:Sir2 silent information regulator family NAD-dependent deacetylase [Paenibacillus sp. CGMCC 1.16610]|uniref:Sir2 silent information regulator family NAD-dependent deacetylase n=1 Tax=Paenibacillus anseongense TaxID=2682845 RepID=A0ABW9UAD6_9BACL|nr:MULTISPECIES: Sir2 family NAD-dependent protein deacetylase [Paenibacillus]MBA2937303.1 Sir2 silent information regulator family NAD-dependent deacetylase [Paenibacillus sp. CGMCC 1.16610]MVQ36361.1 Sir2 silent information regulator family NAD-dependent deacetylase [Paenibacillus anseongense]